MRLQRSDQEHVVNTLFPCRLLQFLICFRISVVDQVKELRQGFIQVVPIPDFVHILPDTVGDIAQALQRISGIVTLRPDRCVTQLRPCFDKEKEQHTVHIPEAFQRQLSGVGRVRLKIPALPRLHIIEDFISQKLNTLPERIFQVLRYAGSIALTLFI